MKQKITETHHLDTNGNPAGGRTIGTGIEIFWQNGPLGRGEDRKEPNGASIRDRDDGLSFGTFTEVKEGQPIPEGVELVRVSAADDEGWRSVTSIYKNERSGPAQVATPKYRKVAPVRRDDTLRYWFPVRERGHDKRTGAVVEVLERANDRWEWIVTTTGKRGECSSRKGARAAARRYVRTLESKPDRQLSLFR